MPMAQHRLCTLQELTSQLQQCQQHVKLLQNLATARSVLCDERDTWIASNGTSHDVMQRIMMDFNRKISEIEAEYRTTVTELLHFVNDMTMTLPQIAQQTLDGPLAMWRMGQKMAQVGFPEQVELRQNAETHLRQVTSHAYTLIDILGEMQSLYAINNETVNWIQSKRSEYQRYLLHLIQKSFVVYKQPPMLVKDWTLRMDLSVRIMADIPTYGGNKNIRRGQVHCCMITEKQAEWLRLQKEDIDFSQAPIDAWSFGHLCCGLRPREAAKENCIKAEWNNVTGEAEFTAVRTKIDNRKTNESKDKAARVEPDDKKSDKMTEKKLYFLFFCKINIDDVANWIWTLSLPFLVAVQTMQEWHLLGVIFWDTAFSALDAIPCSGKEEVTWAELKLALKWLFGKEVQTESQGSSAARELTDEELNHLGIRIFGSHQPFDDSSIKSIADSTGRKGPHDQKGFTFWQWFYGCMDLLEDRSGRILRYHNGKTRKRSPEEKRTMATLFNEGIIRGFVSREATERLLQSCPQTNIMLIRFSDNHCRHEDTNAVPAGYISITCKAVKDGRDTIVNIKPLNREVLARLTLPFVVAHCEYLNNVNYIYVGENRWVEKKRLTINYLPILTEYNEYEGYEKLLLNFNIDGQSEENSATDTPSPREWSSPQASICYRTVSAISEPSPPAYPCLEAKTSPPFTTSANGTTFTSDTAVENPHGVSDQSPFAPNQLMELLTEPPSRRAAIPSKYDEVLSYLISGTEAALSPNVWTEFQPEDDASLCRALSLQ